METEKWLHVEEAVPDAIHLRISKAWMIIQIFRYGGRHKVARLRVVLVLDGRGGRERDLELLHCDGVDSACGIVGGVDIPEGGIELPRSLGSRKDSLDLASRILELGCLDSSRNGRCLVRVEWSPWPRAWRRRTTGSGLEHGRHVLL